MTKADIVAGIAEQTGIPKKEVAVVVNAFLATLREAFLNHERVELRGFGVFTIKNRKRRIGRNPKTLEEVEIPERPAVVFKVSKLIRQKLEK